MSCINFSSSQDGRIVVKACEGLMLLVSLPEPAAAKCLTENTELCELLTDRLVSFYKALPQSIDPLDIETVESVNWGYVSLYCVLSRTTYLMKSEVLWLVNAAFIQFSHVLIWGFDSIFTWQEALKWHPLWNAIVSGYIGRVASFLYYFFLTFISLSFSLDVYNLKEDAAVFTGKRALISFLSWLDYCDQLIKEAQKVLN